MLRRWRMYDYTALLEVSDNFVFRFDDKEIKYLYC